MAKSIEVTPVTFDVTCSQPTRSEKIAFVDDQTAAYSGRYLMLVNPDGTGLTKLREGVSPAWSPDRTRLALCAHGAAGVLEGQGSGYEENETSTRPWIAFGGAGLIEGSIWKRLGWAARVSFFIPAVREKFAVRGIEGDAFDPAQIGVLFSIGPRLTIW